MNRGCRHPIIGLYERAIAACLERDAQQLRGVIIDLTAALNFEYDAAARTLSRLYQESVRQAEAGRFEKPLSLFRLLQRTSAGLATRGAASNSYSTGGPQSGSAE